jgi:hypothetical protein
MGCRIYIQDTPVFLVNFFYNVLHNKLSDRAAWQKAMMATDHREVYQMSYFDSNGVEARYQEG